MQTQDSPRGPSINSVPPDGWSGQAAGPAGSDRLGQPLAAGPEAAQPGRGQVAATAAASPAPSVADLDMLYKETDRLYVELSRGSGLSACASWVMYAIEVGGGTVTQRQIIDRIYYPKQTVNSAVRSLEGKGLLVLAAADADRRSKLVTLTEAGRAFARRHLDPAMRAEARAFASLGPEKAARLVSLASEYARAVHAEVEAMGCASPTDGAVSQGKAGA